MRVAKNRTHVSRNYLAASARLELELNVRWLPASDDSLPMPSVRNQIIHNAKGRAASGGKRKKGKIHKKRKAIGDGEENGMDVTKVAFDNAADSNAAILERKSKEEKDMERKEKMLREVRTTSLSGRTPD